MSAENKVFSFNNEPLELNEVEIIEKNDKPIVAKLRVEHHISNFTVKLVFPDDSSFAINLSQLLDVLRDKTSKYIVRRMT